QRQPFTASVGPGSTPRSARTRIRATTRKERKDAVREYSFRLLLDVAHDLGDDDLNALYEATQSDATFGSDDQGWSAEFDREAPDYASAVLKAIAQLENASVGVHVRKLVSDDESLVSAAEIGRRA